MASISIDGFLDVIGKLNRVEIKTSEKTDKMLNAGADVIVEALKLEATQTFTSDKSTGGLAKSIKKGKPKETEAGKYIDITMNGKNEQGQQYATIGFVLNYGRSNMQARPWVTSARAKSTEKTQQAMANAWNEESE